MGTKMYFIQEGIVDIVMGNGEVTPTIFSISLAFCDLRRFAPLKSGAVEQQNVIWQTDVDELQNYLYRTQVNLGSDLWVRISVTNKLLDVV